MKNVLTVALVLAGWSSFAAEPKRDPFQAPRATVGPVGPGPTECRAASCRLDTSTLQVVGVMTGTSDPRAMVEDAAGHAVVLKRNSPVGSGGARVDRIERGLRTCVYVVQFVASAEGPLQKQTTPYCLPEPQVANALDYLSGALR